MSLTAPSALPKDISVYITRSNELQTAEPLISYFCKLYAVEQILQLGLHTSDETISSFAIQLLDAIEEFKGDKEGKNTDSLEILNDRETSVAYVISFANAIFKNALNQIVNQKSTKATAMALLTSVQFCKLLNLWEDRYPELEESEQLAKKFKYAKYHASRILKAYKNGENPNDYVAPVNDTEVNELLNDEIKLPEFTDDAPGSAPSLPEAPKGEEEDQALASTQPAQEYDELGLPSAPKSIQYSSDTLSSSFTASTAHITKDEESQTDDPAPTFTLPSTPQTMAPSPPHQKKEEKQQHTKIDIEQIIESGEIYAKATKRCKFAISAMNYEDSKTAIKELEEAIKLLQALKE